MITEHVIRHAVARLTPKQKMEQRALNSRNRHRVKRLKAILQTMQDDERGFLLRLKLDEATIDGEWFQESLSQNLNIDRELDK